MEVSLCSNGTTNVTVCALQIDGSAEKLCSTTDDVLEYMHGDDKLRDVVTKVNVIDRKL